MSLFIISGSTKQSDDENLTSDMGGHLMEKGEDLENKVESKDRGESEHVFAISTATIVF